jgi:hypothetical protein
MVSIELTSDGEQQQHTNDGDMVLGGLELPEGDIDGDTTLTLGLELVKNPGVLEGTLAELGGFLLFIVSVTVDDISKRNSCASAKLIGEGQ